MVPGSVWISQCQFNYVDQNEEIQSITGEEFDQPLEQVAGSLWVEPGDNDSWSLCYICENQHKHTIPLVFDHEISDQQVPGSIWINDDKVYVALDLYGQRQAQIPSSVQAQIPVQAPSINGVTITTNTGVIQLQFSDLIYGLLENQTVSPQGKITNGYDNSAGNLITDINFNYIPYTNETKNLVDRCGGFGTRFEYITCRPYDLITKIVGVRGAGLNIPLFIDPRGWQIWPAQITLDNYQFDSVEHTIVMSFKPSSEMIELNQEPYYDAALISTDASTIRMRVNKNTPSDNGKLLLDHYPYVWYEIFTGGTTTETIWIFLSVEMANGEDGKVKFDQWNTLALSTSQNTVNVYLNGKKVISTENHHSITYTNAIEFFDSTYYPRQCNYIGQIDAIKVYNKQFSSKDQFGEYMYACPSQKYALVQHYRTPWVYVPDGVTITDYITDMTTPEGTMIIQDHDKDNRVGDRVWLIQNSVAGQQYGNVYQQLPTDTYTKTTELPVGPIYVAAEYTLYYPEQ